MITDIAIGLEDKNVTELRFNVHTDYRTKKQEGHFGKKNWGKKENKFSQK
jgi:hypothetical protein